MELLFTIAVAAIILSVGVPGFLSFVANNRAVTHTNDLVTALNLGRSEAVRRGSTVIVCSSVDGASCDGNEDWSTGWVVCTEAGGACGQLLRTWPERSGGAGTIVETNDLSQFQFLARGSVTGTTPWFEVRLDNCTGDQGRDVTVNGAGRIAASRVSCL